jgi:Protein of unknown function (DUF402)
MGSPTVVLRMVTRGRLRTAMAAFQLERTARHVVLHVPVGSERRTRSGKTGGPRDRVLLPTDWDDGFVSRPWAGHDLVMVHRFCDQWSTWRWLTDEGSWRAGTYINIECRWLAGEDTFDTDDLTLDLVIGETGEVTFKDEDELAWLEQAGIYSSSEASAIRAVGRKAHQHVTSGGWPMNVDWTTWLPVQRARPPTLPVGWQLQPPLSPMTR